MVMMVPSHTIGERSQWLSPCKVLGRSWFKVSTSHTLTVSIVSAMLSSVVRLRALRKDGQRGMVRAEAGKASWHLWHSRWIWEHKENLETQRSTHSKWVEPLLDKVTDGVKTRSAETSTRKIMLTKAAYVFGDLRWTAEKGGGFRILAAVLLDSAF